MPIFFSLEQFVIENTINRGEAVISSEESSNHNSTVVFVEKLLK